MKHASLRRYILLGIAEGMIGLAIAREAASFPAPGRRVTLAEFG
jgi:hypothetical protein